MKAYVLSLKNGTVQIGDTVFQPATNAIFVAGKIRKKEYVYCTEIPEKSMQAAKLTLQKAFQELF